MDDLERWPDEFSNKKVSVTGILIERHDLTVYIPEDDENQIPHAARVYPKGTDLHEAAHRYLIKDAKWVIVEE